MCARWENARTCLLGLGHCPVRWLNRHALVTLPEHIEESNAMLVSDQLLSIVDSDVLVLILDMTATPPSSAS
jgi:hypothetical protein